MHRLCVYKDFEMIWTDNENFRQLQTKLNLLSVCVEGVLVMIAHSGEWANYSDRTYVHTYVRTLLRCRCSMRWLTTYMLHID